MSKEAAGEQNEASGKQNRPIKEQIVDEVPKKLKALKFGIQSYEDIVRQGVLEVSDNLLYDVDNGRKTYPHGPLDPRMGTSSKSGTCATCHLPLADCMGHFGHVRLPLPVFHIGYLKHIQTTLQNICKECSKVLLSEDEANQSLKELRRPGIDNLKRTHILKKVNEQCRKVKTCPYCGSVQGIIRKLGAIKLAHDKFSTFNRSNAQKKIAPEAKVQFDSSFNHAKKTQPELNKHAPKAMDDLNPLKVLELFQAISQIDCELLGFNPAEGRPELFLWRYIPAPPICIRPSVAQETASNEDDITSKLSEIILYAGILRDSLQKGISISNIMEQWEFLQLQVGLYVNSEVPGLQQPGFGKPIRGFCQRLKGKQGRFRGNLSGKRVDFSGRTVISPDPNLSIEQVAVPQLVAKNLTYPERVNRQNIEKLRQCVLNGTTTWPGAQAVIKKRGGVKFNLKFGGREMREDRARELQVGDIVERHLEDGDIVLFNRQPSLHKLSIMSHRVKVRPWRTFRLNECVCTPYNADFDGDEMNIHVPQTEEARAEAMQLMGVKYNLATPKNGEPIIAATQDFITAAYLLSSKDKFFDKKTFTYICMHMLHGETHLDLPPPVIQKPKMLWTGKQVFNVLMRPNKQSNVCVNLECKNKVYAKKGGDIPDMDIDDCYLVVRNSEVMCGRMDKATVGGGKKNSVFYVVLRDFGPDEAAAAMTRLAKLCARLLTLRGFSIGVGDVYPSTSLTAKKSSLVENAYGNCDDLIETFRQGKLQKAAGCNLEETLENSISGILSKVRQQAGDYCVETLSRNNAPLIMAKSGSKGSDINVAQMIACVGQQIISGKRVADGFQDRTLPHFHKNSRQPPSKGFVRNSFYTGLLPTEFIFHAISGREGLVDTAVKTAETGYMSRRLMKSLEDLSTHYDDTVRTSEGGVVQFQFGADRLDPVDMEGEAQPVNFLRSWNHVESVTWNNNEKTLLPSEIYKLSKEILDIEREKYPRKHLATGERLFYDDETIHTSDDYDVMIAIDEHEGARAFLNSIQDFINERLLKLAHARKMAGLDPRLPTDTKVRDKFAKLEAQKAAARKKKGVEAEDAAMMDVDMDVDMLDIDGQEAHADRVAKVSETTLRGFILVCLDKYRKAVVEPGHAVGAVGAQSIGEPGTQMTLKTFHFAGVAGMSITQGVPRIKEIINASKFISTPVIECPLQNNKDIAAARVVKGRIEKTYISDIISYIDDEWRPDVAKIVLKLDLQALADMELEISLKDIADAIVKAKKLKLKIEADDLRVGGDRIEIIVRNTWNDVAAAKRAAKQRAAAIEKGMATGGTGIDESAADFQLRVNFLKRMIPHVAVSGYPQANRAIIQTSEVKDRKDEYENKVLVEGYGLRACMTTVGVVGTQVVSNSVMECRDVLGIEAARTTIAKEIGSVMGSMGIDPRHMDLLADVMTYKGEVLGITRFGLAKMRDSVLQLASFEKTPEHLFDAAAGMKTDKIDGVSECIIMGQAMSIGTGSFQVVRRLGIREHQLAPKPVLFEEVWKKYEAANRKAKAAKRGMGMGRGQTTYHGTTVAVA